MPVIVTGTGRCGSSAVARVLHEHLGVFMGERFDRIRPPNPEGTYEDLDFRDLHVALGRGELDREEFEARARELIAGRNAEHGERWGFKDPRASYLIDFYRGAISGHVLVVIPFRQQEAVVRSIHRHYGTPFEEAEFETERRTQAIEAAFNRHVPVLYGELSCGSAAGGDGQCSWLLLDMNEHVGDDQIAEIIGNSIERLAGAA